MILCLKKLPTTCKKSLRFGGSPPNFRLDSSMKKYSTESSVEYQESEGDGLL